MPFIMATVLIDMISIGLIIPVMPALVGSFTGSKGDQAHWYGMLAFCFGIANFFASPVLGALSDRFGRRPVLLIGFLGFGISFFGTALATSLTMLIGVRIAAGALQANAAIANAYVADITPPEKRAKRFGLLGAMMGLGFILGPVIGGLLGSIYLQLPFWVAGCLAMLNLVYGYFVLPESLSVDKRRHAHWRTINPFSSLRALAQLKNSGALIGVLVFTGLAQFTLYTSWVLVTTYKFGWGPQQNGWSLAVVGVVSVATQGFLMGRLLKRVSPQRLLIWGLMSAVLANVLYGVVTEAWMLYAVIAFNLLGTTVNASAQSMVSAAAGSHNQGSIMGAASALSSLMAVLAPLLATPILEAVSDRPQGDWLIGAPFYFCSVLQALALVMAVRHMRRHKRAASLVP